MIKFRESFVITQRKYLATKRERYVLGRGLHTDWFVYSVSIMLWTHGMTSRSL